MLKRPVDKRYFKLLKDYSSRTTEERRTMIM